MITREETKSQIERILVDKSIDNQLSILNSLMGAVTKDVMQDYDISRDLIQFTIGQLERIPSVCVPFFFQSIIVLLKCISIDANQPAYLDYIKIDWNEVDIKSVMGKIMPFFAGEQRTFDCHTETADVLSLNERRLLASYFVDAIHNQGIKTQWTKDEIYNSILYCNILYPLCKKDGVMSLLFNIYDNVLDRLNSSGYHQDARDLAEGILIIGYNEGFEAEAFFSLCRAYTAANNSIAGILFYYFCLSSLNHKGRIVNKRFAYDLYWQYIKLCRAHGIYPDEDISFIVEQFEELNCGVYERLSFYHTLFSTRVMSKNGHKNLVNDITDFLNQNREAFFKNIEHGAMPWISLLVSIQEVLPEADYSGVQPYVTAARQIIPYQGNDLYLDLFDGIDLAKHLKSIIFKLQETRNRSDFAMDNQMAIIIAKRLLSQAYEDYSPSDFLLAMSPKTDFSMVLPYKEVTGFYKRLEISDADGDKLNSVFCNLPLICDLLYPDEKDVIYWIGRGKNSYLVISLFLSQFIKNEALTISDEQIKYAVNGLISNLKYERDIKYPGKPIYEKTDEELEKEGSELVSHLGDFSISVPEDAVKLIFIKDLEIAAYPHNLFIDKRLGILVSSTHPCCNALSTEVLLKTNTLDPLPNGYSKKFWIPFGSGEFTFDMIYSKLEDVITTHGIQVCNSLSKDKPINADIVLLCAHGAFDISKTEVLYVDEKPIIDTVDCIGEGIAAILLICYSGTISRSFYDNAMHSIVKKLIMKGYSSVVAPMWSLPTEIITPWLSTFLVSLEEGDYIIDSVFKANMQIKELFVAPSAWACLHLFGNPYIRVADKPRVEISFDNDTD